MMANDNLFFQRRMSQKSTLSANSDGMRSGSSSRRGSAYNGDTENCASIPAVTVGTNDSGKIIKGSGSRRSTGKKICNCYFENTF